MTKKEFYLVAVIAVYIYLAFVFQINLKNFVKFQENPNAEYTYNLFE